MRDNWPLYQICRYLTFCKASEDGDGPRGEGDTHIRRTGVLLKNFDPLRSPKRYQDPVSSPRKDTNSYITHYLPASYFFRLNTLKGIAKAPALDLLRLNTLRATKTSFLTPIRYDELPRPGGRGQGIQTAPCSPRVGRVFSLCLREKMETAVEPAQPPLHKGPPLCNGHFSFQRTVTLILISLQWPPLHNSSSH